MFDDIRRLPDQILGMATTNGTVIPSGEINIHIVDVGMNDSMLYAPNDIKAAPGDIVSFRFWNNHSVVESQYGFPCVPNNDLTGRPIFYSGMRNMLIPDTSGERPTR